MGVRRRRGFTIIEMGLVALAMMIFAVIGMTRSTSSVDTAKLAAANVGVASISSAVSRYRYEMGSYPVNLQALTGTSGSLGPWIATIPTTDPWGNTNGGVNGTSGGTCAYRYGYTNSRFAVWSSGPNGVNNSGGSGTSLPVISGDDVGVISK